MTVQKRSPPPNYFSRREQYRLLVMCSLLMFVLVMMNEVRKPEMWSWMWDGAANEARDVAANGGNAVEAESNPTPARVSSSKPIDTLASENRSRQNRPSLPVDGFRSVSHPVAPPRSNNSDGQLTPQDGRTSTKESGDYLVGITAELFGSIEDNSVLRVAENDAWQTVLGVLQQTTQIDIESASIGYVSFSQLFRQTSVYRGHVVEIRGTIRRAEEIATRRNPHGIERLYRWIVEPAGPSNAPIVVYSLEKPSQLSIGSDLREDVICFGVCFKRWAYAAGDGTRIAPLILAKTVNWQPRPTSPPVRVPSWPVATLTLIGIAALAGVIALLVYRNSNLRHADVERARGYLSRGVDHLKDSEVLPSVEQSLRELEQAEVARVKSDD